MSWGVAEEASGVEENRYGLRGGTSSLHRRGNEVATSLCLIHDDGVEDDDEQYNENWGMQDFDNFVEVELRRRRIRCWTINSPDFVCLWFMNDFVISTS